MRSTISSVTFCTLAAMSQWNCSIGPSILRTGCPKSLAKRSLVMVRP